MSDLCADGVPSWLADAVTETLDSIDEGADPLSLEGTHRELLRVEFTAKFCRNLSDEDEWLSYRDDVLGSARRHGEIARNWTQEWFGDRVEYLDPALTGFAGLYVQLIVCPPVAGIPCELVDFVPRRMLEQIREMGLRPAG